MKRANGKLRLPATLAEAIDDRMLIAQAMRLDAVVVSRDRAFASYDVKVLTA